LWLEYDAWGVTASPEGGPAWMLIRKNEFNSPGWVTVLDVTPRTEVWTVAAALVAEAERISLPQLRRRNR